MTNKQIQQIRELKPWTTTSFHGNRKKLGHLSVSLIQQIVKKKQQRERLKYQTTYKTDTQKVRDLISWSLKCKGTSYFKHLIEGTNSIYYASPVYRHNDYNKSRLFDKNEKTLKLIRIFNAIVG